MELDDKQILIKIKKGEIEHFSHIVKKYTHTIYKYIYSKLFDKHDVDDLVQNTFLNFYKSIHRFDAERPVLPYLFEISKNELKMYFRSKKKTYSLNDALKVGMEREYEPGGESIDELLKFLAEDQKKALQLLSEGYSYEEISKIMKKPLNTVRTIIRRARLKLSASRRKNP